MTDSKFAVNTKMCGAADRLGSGGVIQGTWTGLRGGLHKPPKIQQDQMQGALPGLGQSQYSLWDEGIKSSHGEGLDE